MQLKRDFISTVIQDVNAFQRDTGLSDRGLSIMVCQHRKNKPDNTLIFRVRRRHNFRILTLQALYDAMDANYERLAKEYAAKKDVSLHG